MSGYVYTRQVVESLLDCVWDDDWAILASRAEQEQTTGGSGPGDGMNAVVFAADVRKAWSKLTWHEQDLIRARHLYERSLDAIADLAGYETVEKAADELEAAIGLLVDFTNGAQR